MRRTAIGAFAIGMLSIFAAAAPTQSRIDVLPAVQYRNADVDLAPTSSSPDFDGLLTADIPVLDVDITPKTETISTGQLGEGDTLSLQRPGGRREIGVTVPEGMVLTGYSGVATVPTAVHQAQLSVLLNGQIVLETIIDGGSSREIELLFENPITTDAALEFVVEERHGTSCTSTVLEPTAMRVTDNDFYFERQDFRPSTIAQFFPPIMTDVIVVTSEQPGSSVTSASYQLAAAMARRYPVVPSFSITRGSVTDPVVSPDAFSRTIVLRDSDAPSVTVRQADAGAYLLVAGPPGVLEQLAATLSAPELALVANEAALADLPEQTERSDDLLAQRSLEDVGVRRLVTSGSRVLQLPISLPQATFGEPVSEIQIRIGGLSIASGLTTEKPSLSLWINDNLQDSIVPDDSGRFDIDFVLEGAQLERDNLIVIRSDLALGCGQELPTHELQIDSGSWVDAESGQSLAPSLDRFPQVVIEELAVAAGSTDAETETALTIVAALQASSPVQLDPEAVSAKQLARGEAAGILVTNGEGTQAEPFASDLTTVRTGSIEFVSDAPPTDLAFVSASSAEDGTDVLVVFSPADPVVATSFNDLVTDQGWSSFSGSVVGINADDEVITSNVMNESEQQTLSTLRQESPSVVRQFGVGILAVLVLAVSLFLLRGAFTAIGRLR